MEKRPEPAYPPFEILVAMDGSESSFRASRYATGLASSTKSRVTLVHVILLPPVSSEETARMIKKDLASMAENFLKEAEKTARANSVDVNWKILETNSSVVKTIVDYADSAHTSLIVTGTRGVSGYGKMALGSVAAGIVGLAHCPVLTVR